MTGANKCLFGGGKESCQKHRMYAFPGEKAQFCSIHKKPGMVDVHNKRCEAESCQKHPTYGLPNGRARFCTKHKGPDMVDVHCRPCEHAGCSKHPHYAFEGDKARFCASHKEPGMVDVKHKRCHTAGCKEMRVYETPSKKSRFCMVHLEEWLSAKTTRRAPPDRASPKQQTSSAAMNAVNTVASDVNDGRGGRSRIPNNPFTPKMEYSDNNGQGMMGVDNCRPMSFVDQESGFSSGMRVDNGSGQGLKRRVHQVPKPRTSVRGFPDRAGGITVPSGPASPVGSMAKNGERTKHTGAISVAIGNIDHNVLLSSPISRRTRDVGVGRNGHISPVDVHGGGRQTLLPSSPLLSAQGLCHLDPSGVAGSIGGNCVDSRGRREPQAEAGLLSPTGGMGPSSSPPSYRRGHSNNGDGGSPGGDTGGGYPRGAKHEIIGDSGEKRLRTSSVGVSMAMSPTTVNGGGYTKDEILVYGQRHGEEDEDHQQQRQRQSSISQHYHEAGVSQEEEVYSAGKGDRFNGLSPGIFPPSSSETGAGGGGVGGERRRSRLDEFGMPHRRDGDGAMVGQMPEGSGSRSPSYGYPGEDVVSSTPLPPLSKDSTSIVPQKRGHRRHASFDPNTDCFAQQFSLGNGGASGRGGQFPLITGNDSHGYTGPVAGLGSGGGGGFSGGSFGSSSNGRHHVRGCSSGSVDLNVLAPVLAELRTGGGGSIGGGNNSHSQYPLPPSRQHDHEHAHHAPSNDRDHHYPYQQQPRHHGSGVALPVVAEPGTPPHILSDDAASAPSPKNTATHHGSAIAPSHNTRGHGSSRGDTEVFHQQQGFRVDVGRSRHYNEGPGGGEDDYSAAAHFYGGSERQGGEHQHHDQRAQHLAGPGSPRWGETKATSSLYMDGQGSPTTAVSHHLNSGRELHPGEDMVHGDGSGSPRVDGSRVDKGTIWIRRPDGMTAGGNGGGGGGRRHLMQH